MFYRHKPDTAAQEIAGATPRDYLTHWLSQWVRDYGIDGFRVDTAKHVEAQRGNSLNNKPPLHWLNGKRPILNKHWITYRSGWPERHGATV